MAVTGLIPGRRLEAPAGLPLLKLPHSPLGGSCGGGPPRALEEWRPGWGRAAGRTACAGTVMDRRAAIHGSTGKRRSGWGSRAGPQASQRDGAGGAGSKERP